MSKNKIGTMLVAGMSLVWAVNALAATSFSNTIDDKGSVTVAQGDKTAHKAGLGYKCYGDATITMTNAKGADDGILWYLVEATNGTATVDISDCGFKTFTFGGGLVANYKGKVILKASEDLTTVYLGSTYITTPLPYDLGDFEIQIGGKRTTAVPLVLKDCFCLMRPPASDMTWSVASGSKVTLADASSAFNVFPTGEGDLLAKFYDANGVLDIGPNGLDLLELTIMSPNALTVGKTLRLGGSVTARFYMTYFADWWSQWGLKGGLGSNARANEKMRPKFNIDLAGDKCAFNSGDTNGVFIDGDVTGTGSFRISGGGKDYSYIYFVGKYLATGPFVSFVGATGNSQAKVIFTNPDGYLGDANSAKATVELGSNHTIAYELTGQGPYTANIGSFASSYMYYSARVVSTNVALSVSENLTLAIDDIDGAVKVTDGLANIVAEDSVLLRTTTGDYLAGTGHGTIKFDSVTGELVKIEAYNATTAEFDVPLVGVGILATNGAEVVLSGTNNEVSVDCAADSLVSVTDIQWMDYLDSDISLWLDATKAYTSTNLYAKKDYGGFKVGDVVTYKIPGKTEPVASVDNWSDWRAGRKGAFSNTIYNNASESFWLPSYANFYPHLMYDGPNGKAYMSLYGNNTSCRFHGYYWPGSSAKFAVMVFGSQYGGGSSILAVNGEKFGRDRSSHQNPIVTNAAYASGYFWVNGEAVDPTKTGFNGGWQVISCKIPDLVKGLGFSRAASGQTADAGDQNYGEIVFFDQVPDDDDRQRVERYLANKWGLLEGYKGTKVSSKISATGEGTIEIGMNAQLSGGFRGTFEVDSDINVTVSQHEVPGEEAVVAANRTAWFDAEYEGSLAMSTASAARPLNVARWYDRSGVVGDGTFVDGTPYAHNFSGDNRSPSLQEVNGRKWLDFSHYYGLDGKSPSDNPDYNVVSGNMLRFGVTPNAVAKDPVPVTNKTIFVVQDSSKGGGTAFLGGINAPSDLGARYVKKDVQAKSVAELAAMPILASHSTTTFAGGATYLNGKAVDGAKTGLTGGPEVLTAMTDGTKEFPLGCFGYYLATDGTTNTDVGEIIGEVIAYNTTLDDDRRADIEAYLMWKWLGRVREGYDPIGGLSQAEISGAGKYVIDTYAGNMPKLSEDFTGTVECKASSLAFTLANGEVVNPLDAKGGKLMLPAAVTVSVSGELTDGTYTLVRAAELPAGTTFTLTGTYSEDLKVNLVRGENEVTLRIASRKGMLLILK